MHADERFRVRGPAKSASRFQLHVEKGADIRESAFRLAVSEGWVLLELSTRSTSLEEVFHKLTMS